VLPPPTSVQTPQPEPPGPPPVGGRPPDERQLIALLRWLLYAVFVVVGYVVLRYLAQILGPVLAAFGIAYLLDPVVERIVARGVSRAVAATLILVLFLGTLAATIIALTPRVTLEVSEFVQALPSMVEAMTGWANDTLGIQVPLDWKLYLQSDELKSLLHDAAGPLRLFAVAALGGLFSLLGFLAELLLVPVFAYYFLLDWPHIKHRVARVVPPRRRSQVLAIAAEVDAVVSGWVRGQATVTILLVILYAIGFSLLGIHLAIPIGIVVGALTVIPFVGTFVGAAIAIGITLLDWQGIEPVVGVGVVIVVLHLLEAMVLTPKIVGHRVGLSESAALFAVVAGGKLLGFVGILLAVPLAATVAVLLRHVVRYYETTDFFGTEADAVVPVPVAMSVVLPGDGAPPPGPAGLPEE
jgi:predicted PurR-regulated permease PerM